MDLLQAFDEHHRPVFRFAYRLTGSVADAEDVVQACFLELLRPDCSYDPERAPLRTWLFGVARNQSLKRIRQRGSAILSESSNAPTPENEILRGELERVVQQAVMSLPEQQREVLILAHYEQVPLVEIATILGTEVGAVKSRLQRARGNLREALAAYAPKVEQKP
ncbi:MAG TPA: RNA polymerase sigma factor [Terriglobia bacterium]|nr:RNA polymerase sigma factor [Terriglobia bacterium]